MKTPTQLMALAMALCCAMLFSSCSWEDIMNIFNPPKEDPPSYNMEDLINTQPELTEDSLSRSEYILLANENSEPINLQSDSFELRKICPCNQRLQSWKGPGIDPEGERDRASRKASSEGGFFDYNQPIKTMNLREVMGVLKNPNDGGPIPWTEYFDLDEACPSYHQNNGTSDTIKIAVIDSGIQHPNLDNFVVAPSPHECYLPNFVSDNEPNSYADQIAHGTHIAGIIAKNWPEDIRLELIPFKIFGETDQADLFDGVCAIYAAVQLEVDIINLSWGFKYDTIPPVLEQALLHAADNDIYVVCSSGNMFTDNGGIDNDLNQHWPSNFSAQGNMRNFVISVGSYTSTGMPPTQSYEYSDFANYGDLTVDVATDGHMVNSTIPEAPGCCKASGTSMAAAEVSRLLGINLSNSTCVNRVDCLLSSAIGTDDSDNDTAGGFLSPPSDN